MKVAGAGVHRLALRDLPQGLTLEDVRVAARGPQGSRLGDVSVGAEPRLQAASRPAAARANDERKLRTMGSSMRVCRGVTILPIHMLRPSPKRYEGKYRELVIFRRFAR